MINDMQLSRAGYLEVASHEGVILQPYKDTQGVWTIGIGHTDNDSGLKPSKMKTTDTITVEQAIAMYKEDMKYYAARVNKYVTSPLTQNQFDALVSFDYNTGGIGRATLTRYVNEGRRADDIAKAFMMWTKNKELVGRRTKEKSLFLYGTYVSTGTVLLLQTDGKGHVLQKGARNIKIDNYF